MDTGVTCKIRCGEVFFTRYDSFEFYCTLCKGRYKDFSNLLRHIKNQHCADLEWNADVLSISELGDNEEMHNEFDVQIVNGDTESKAAATESGPYNEWADQDFDSIDKPLKKNELHCQDPNKAVIAYEISDDEDDGSLASLYSSERKPDFYACKHCDRKYKERSKLRSHMITHSDERKYKCDQCNHAFKVEYNLRAHQRRHAGIRDYDCSFCSKQFFTRPELRVHVRRHHTKERPYICTDCGLSFTTLGALTLHMKRHTNDRKFKCDYCEKRFITLAEKRNHEIVHTQERRHLCTVCNAAFGRRKALLVHIKLHENAKEYVCDFCQAAFNQKQSLLAHRKSKHKTLCNSSLTILPQTHGVVEGVTTCLECNIKFENASLLLEHDQSMHSTKVEEEFEYIK